MVAYKIRMLPKFWADEGSPCGCAHGVFLYSTTSSYGADPSPISARVLNYVLDHIDCTLSTVAFRDSCREFSR